MISEATAERRRRMRKEWRYGDGDEEAERFWEGEGVGWKMRMSNGRELQTAQLSPPPSPAQNISYTLIILGGRGPDGRGCEMKKPKGSKGSKRRRPRFPSSGPSVQASLKAACVYYFQAPHPPQNSQRPEHTHPPKTKTHQFSYQGKIKNILGFVFFFLWVF